MDRFFDDFLWYFDDFLWYLFFFELILKLFYNFFIKSKNITKKNKISTQILFFFLAQIIPTMEPKKSSKTAKMDFAFFGTRREHEKIAKMQRYSPRKLSKIIIIKICLIWTIMLHYMLDLTFFWKTIIFNNSFEKKSNITIKNVPEHDSRFTLLYQ